MRIRGAILTACLLATASPTTGSEQEYRILIHEFRLGVGSEGMDARLSQSVPNLIRKGIVDLQLDGVALLERDEMARLWKDKGRSEDLPQVYDTSTAVEVGRVLEASYVLLGELASWDNATVDVTARLVEVKTTRIVAEDSEQYSKGSNPRFLMECLGVGLMEEVFQRKFLFRDNLLRLVVASPRHHGLASTQLRPDAFANNIQSTLISKLEIPDHLSLFQREEVNRMTWDGSIAEICGKNSADAVVTTNWTISDTGVLQLTIQILEKCEGEVVSSFSLKGPVEDRMKLVESAALKLIERTEVKLSGAERLALQQPETTDLAAYDLFGQGLAEFDRANYSAASTLFRMVLQIDPGYAKALFYLAKSQRAMGNLDEAERHLRACVGRLGELSEEHWEHLIGEPSGVRPILAHGLVYYGTDSGRVITLDVQKGTKIREFEIPASVSRLGRTKDSLVVLSKGTDGNDTDNLVLVIDPLSGSVIRRIPLDVTLNNLFSIHDDTLFLGGEDGELYVVDLLTGGIETLMCRGEVGYSSKSNVSFLRPATVIVSGALVRADTESLLTDFSEGFVQALDLSTKSTLWTRRIPQNILAGQRLVDGVVYAGSYDGRLYALDSENGDILWSYKTQDTIFAKPAVQGDDILLGGEDNFLYALSRDGRQRWKVNTHGAISSEPLATTELVVVKNRDGLSAYDLRSGTLRWTRSGAQRPTTTTIALTDNILLLMESGESADSGRIYAIDLSIMDQKEEARDKNSNAYLELGAVLFEQERFGDAIGALKQAVQLDENKREAYRYLANALKREGRTFEAVKYLEKYRSFLGDESQREAIAEEIRRDTGLRWSRTVPREAREFVTYSLLHRDSLLVGSFEDIDEIDLVTGRVTRTIEVPGLRSYFAVSNNIIYYADQLGKVRAYDPDRKATLWVFDTGVVRQFLLPVPDGDRLFVSAVTDPVVEGQLRGGEFPIPRLVKLGTSPDVDRLLWCLDIHSGELLWDVSVSGAVANFEPVSQSIALTGSYDASRVSAVDTTTGQILWEFSPTGSVKVPPMVLENRVYVASSAFATLIKGFSFHSIVQHSYNDLSALDVSTGAQYWSFQFLGSSLIALSGNDEMVLLTTKALAPSESYDPEDTLYAIDRRSGRVRWIYEPPAQISASPLIHEDTVFVAMESGSVIALNRRSGRTQNWEIDVHAPIRTAPFVDRERGQLVVVSADGGIWAFELPDLPSDTTDTAYEGAFEKSVGSGLDEAVAAFDTLLSANPDCGNCYYQRAELRRQGSDLPGTLQDLKLAESHLPRSKHLGLMIARAHILSGEHAEAVKQFERILDRQDSDRQLTASPVFHDIAHSYLSSGRYEEGARAALARSNAYLDSGQNDQARQELEWLLGWPIDVRDKLAANFLLLVAAQEGSPGDRDLYIGRLARIVEEIETSEATQPTLLPFVYELLGKPDKAMDGFERLLEIHPDDLQLRQQVADFHWRHGRFNAAADELAFIEEADGEYFEREIVKPPLGAYDSGNMEEAVQGLVQLALVHPDNIAYALAAGHALVFLEEYQRGVEYLEAALRLDPSLCEGYALAAMAHNELDMVDAAERNYQDAIACDPKNPTAYNNLAYFYAERNLNLEKALPAVNQAIELDEKSAHAHDTRGWVYYRMGRFEEALLDLERALALYSSAGWDPETRNAVAETHYHMGEVYFAVGKTERAEASFRNALSSDSTFEPAAEALDRIGASRPPVEQ